MMKLLKRQAGVGFGEPQLFLEHTQLDSPLSAK
jgi:hypothetical protein